jgi:hypothetical protein
VTLATTPLSFVHPQFSLPPFGTVMLPSSHAPRLTWLLREWNKIMWRVLEQNSNSGKVPKLGDAMSIPDSALNSLLTGSLYTRRELEKILMLFYSFAGFFACVIPFDFKMPLLFCLNGGLEATSRWIDPLIFSYIVIWQGFNEARHVSDSPT